MPDKTVHASRATGIIASCLMLTGSPLALGQAFAQNAASASPAVIDEMVVTARKRAETLSDVPMSITAISGDQIESQGIVNVADLYGGVPGLYFSSSVATPVKDYIFLVIRGVGANSGGEPSVGTFVDGVYAPSLGFDLGFLDLERVEVLRGPQGTLFGRNTQGGALNIVTRRPGQEFRGRAAIEVDEFETFRFQGAVSGPAIADTLSLGFSMDAMSTQGFADNIVVGDAAETALGQGKTFETSANDRQSLAFRGSALYQPTDNIEAYLTLDWNRSTGNDVAPGFIRGCECFETQNEFQLDHEFENYGFALNVDVDFDAFSLTSITGGRRLESQAPFDFDGSADFTGNIYDLRTEQEILSQELRLTSNGQSAFDWVGGVYLFIENQKQDRDFFFPDLDTIFAGINVDSQIVENDRTGGAVFGQVSYDLTDRLEITAGARYAYEEVDNTADVDYTIPLLGPAVIDFFDTPSESFDGFTPMASILYRLGNGKSIYATYSEGFKAGGFQKNTATLESNLPFDSERSRNFEVGFKGSFLDRRALVDFSLFRVDIENQQLQTIVEVGDGNVPVSAIASVGESRTQGFELATTFLITDALRFEGNVGYVDAEFEQFIDEDGTDRSGDPFPYVPEWTGDAAIEYRTPVAGGAYDFVLRGNYRYVGAYETGTGTGIDPIFQIDAYDRIDLRLALESDTWEFTVFAENLLDSYDVTHVWNAFFFADNAVNFDQVLPPRRIGVRAQYSF